MIFSQPFPVPESSVKNLKLPAIAGLMVFLMLLLFRPFGLNEIDSTLLPIHTLIYGLCTFLMAAVNTLFLPIILPRLFIEQRWTVGREMLLMLWLVITIAFANIGITILLYGGHISLPMVAGFLAYTIAIGIFPVTFSILLKYILLLRKNGTIASSMELAIPDVKPHANVPVQVDIITLRGDYLQDLLEVPVDAIRFITSADNYIKVYYVLGDKLTFQVLRSTIKKMEDTLATYPQFFRCHRAYLVNLKSINHISGNAQGLKLHAIDMEVVIPVSRSLNLELQNRLQLQNAISVHP